MAFEDIAVVDVGVEPGATGDNYRFTFLLSRVPDRFWPEAFLVAYGAQSGLRRVELAERTVTITLREAEATAYATAVGAAVRLGQRRLSHRARPAGDGGAAAP